MCEAKRYGFTAMTDVWTGSADGESNTVNSVGLIGSVRWWYENLIRWMGGYACDPNDDNPEERCNGKDHCVACELFGCTGWARKFRFGVYDESGETVKHKQIKKGDVFFLRFDPIRPISDVEWALLHMTMRLISDYGAIGGRTTSIEGTMVIKKNGKEKKVEVFSQGIIALVESNNNLKRITIESLDSYITQVAFFRKNRYSRAFWGSDRKDFQSMALSIDLQKKDLPISLKGVGGQRNPCSRRVFTFVWENPKNGDESARTFYFSPNGKEREWLRRIAPSGTILFGDDILKILIREVAIK